MSLFLTKTLTAIYMALHTALPAIEALKGPSDPFFAQLEMQQSLARKLGEIYTIDPERYGWAKNYYADILGSDLIPPEFLVWDLGQKIQLLKILANDPKIIHADATWYDLSEEERIEILDHIADIMIDIYSQNLPFPLKKPSVQQLVDSSWDGRYWKGDVYINVRNDADRKKSKPYLSTLTSSIFSIIHEISHSIQDQMIQNMTRLPDSPPLRQTAEQFSIGLKFYSSLDENKRAYMRNILEIAAESAGTLTNSYVAPTEYSHLTLEDIIYFLSDAKLSRERKMRLNKQPTEYSIATGP